MDGTSTLRADAERMLSLMVGDEDNVSAAMQTELRQMLEMCARSASEQNHTLLLTQYARVYRRNDSKSKEYTTEPLMRPDKNGNEVPAHYRFTAGEKGGWELENLQSYLEPDSPVLAEWTERTRLLTLVIEVEQGRYGPLLNLYSVPANVMTERLLQRAGQIRTDEDTLLAVAAEKDWRHNPEAFQVLGPEEFSARLSENYNFEKGAEKLTYSMVPDRPGFDQQVRSALDAAKVPAAIAQRGAYIMVMYPSFTAEQALAAMQAQPDLAPHVSEEGQLEFDKYETAEMREDFPEAFVPFDAMIKRLKEEPQPSKLHPAIGTEDVRWLPPDVRRAYEQGAALGFDKDGFAMIDPNPKQVEVGPLTRGDAAEHTAPAPAAKAPSRTKPVAKEPTRPVQKPVRAEAQPAASEPAKPAPEPHDAAEQEPLPWEEQPQMDAGDLSFDDADTALETEEPAAPEPEDLSFDEADTEVPLPEAAERSGAEDLSFDEADTEAPVMETEPPAKDPPEPASHEPEPAKTQPAAKAQEPPARTVAGTPALSPEAKAAQKKALHSALEGLIRKKPAEPAKEEPKEPKKSKAKSKSGKQSKGRSRYAGYGGRRPQDSPKVHTVVKPKAPDPSVPPLTYDDISAPLARGTQPLDAERRDFHAAERAVNESGRQGYIPKEQYKAQQEALRATLDSLVTATMETLTDPVRYTDYLHINAKAPGLSPKNVAALMGQNKAGNLFKTAQEWWSYGYGVDKHQKAKPTYLWVPKDLTNPETGETYKVYNARPYYDASQTFASKIANDGKQIPPEERTTPIPPEVVMNALERLPYSGDPKEDAIRAVTKKLQESIKAEPIKLEPEFERLAVCSAAYVTCVNLGLDLDNTELGQRLTSRLHNASAETIKQAFATPAVTEHGKDGTAMDNILHIANKTAASAVSTIRNGAERIRTRSRTSQQAKPQKTNQKKKVKAGSER